MEEIERQEVRDKIFDVVKVLPETMGFTIKVEDEKDNNGKIILKFILSGAREVKEMPFIAEIEACNSISEEVITNCVYEGMVSAFAVFVRNLINAKGKELHKNDIIIPAANNKILKPNS